MNDFWEQNAAPWANAIETQSIESRKVTNAALIQLIVERPVQNLLDIGCGEGWLARALPKSITYFGIDGSRSLIEKAKASSAGDYAVVSYADIQRGSWVPVDKFDAVVFNFALFEQDISAVLNAARRALKPSGVVVIQTLHPCFQPKPYQDMWLIEDFKTISPEFTSTMKWYRRTLSSWISTIAHAGLTLQQVVEPAIHGVPASIIFVLKLENL